MRAAVLATASHASQDRAGGSNLITVSEAIVRRETALHGIGSWPFLLVFDQAFLLVFLLVFDQAFLLVLITRKTAHPFEGAASALGV